jgi:hypothetical protein
MPAKHDVGMTRDHWLPFSHKTRVRRVLWLIGFVSNRRFRGVPAPDQRQLLTFITHVRKFGVPTPVVRSQPVPA